MCADTLPFFSICMPVTNRAETIFAALVSVARQTYRDFELIVVDCGSTDNSRQEVERFFSGEWYTQNPFPYTFQSRNYIPQTVEDWNEPVLLARGRYIAMLEGDDQFTPAYLQTAYEKLHADPRIGLYSTGNQNKKRVMQGLIPAEKLGPYIYSHTEVPPPSEAIFVRLNPKANPYLYNTQDYEYAPEVDLYIRIALDGYNAFFDDQQNTIRDVSLKNRTSWHYVNDRFVIAAKYVKDFGNKEKQRLVDKSSSLAIHNSIISKDLANFRDIRSRLSREIGFRKYYCRLITEILSGAGRKFRKIFFK